MPTKWEALTVLKLYDLSGDPIYDIDAVKNDESFSVTSKIIKNAARTCILLHKVERIENRECVELDVIKLANYRHIHRWLEMHRRSDKASR